MRPRVYSLVLVAILASLALSLPISAQGRGGDAVIAQRFVLESGERHDSDLVIVGGEATLESGSVVEGDLFLMGGAVEVAGTVEGDLVALGSTVELTATALVEGNLVVFGTLRRHADARIEGSVVEGIAASGALSRLPQLLARQSEAPEAIESPQAPRATASGPSWLGRLFRALGTTVGFLLVAVLVVLLVPDNLGRMVAVIDGSPFLCIGVGLLTIVIVAMLTPLLIIICIGIPVALVLFLALFVALLIGWVAVGKTVGQRLYQVLGKAARSQLEVTSVGILLATLVSTVSWVGPIFSTLALCLGLGSVVLSRLGTQAHPVWGVALPQVGAPQSAWARSANASSVRAPERHTKRLDQGSLPESVNDGATP